MKGFDKILKENFVFPKILEKKKKRFAETQHLLGRKDVLCLGGWGNPWAQKQIWRGFGPPKNCCGGKMNPWGKI